MEPPIHSIASLFNQLGLTSTEEAIVSFVQKNSPIPAGVLLSDSEIWSASQAAFLRRMLEDDADWAEVVDQLNAMLR